MNGDKKVILHLVFDGIFFDRVYPRFEGMEKYENRYLLDQLDKKYQFKYIKNTERILKVDNLEEWGKVISNQDVDIIYLHGLWQSYINAVDYIRENVVVMWWCYGMEIYENVHKWPPLLPLKLFKPRTYGFLMQNSTIFHALNIKLSYSFPRLYILLISIYNLLKGHRRNKFIQLLSRIDYAFTPLSTELDEIKRKYHYIKAKPFELRVLQEKKPLEIHKESGGILLEHSANVTNNHLDIIAFIKKKRLTLNRRDIFIPLSYGDKKLAECVKKEAIFAEANVHCLMDALPFNEYSEVMNGCTHSIYGMIRQSGLGNIYLCFKKGIKVFFFKDSILFKHFKKEGYHVFSIEDDLNDNSIKEPLTPEQAKNNYDLFYSKFEDTPDTYEQQFDKILK